jgi:hypothetical protein
VSGHRIVADIDYVGAFLFETAPAASLVPDYDMDGIPDAPPPTSGYRDAEVGGIACWNCAHFSVVSADTPDQIQGVCNLWEAQAQGGSVCDRFTAHADMHRQSPHTSWMEDVQQMQRDQASGMSMDMPMMSLGPSKFVAQFGDKPAMAEIGFSAAEAVEENGLIWKDILRTGHWTHTPTGNGVVAKELRIVKDGDSDPDNGLLSLGEILSNFEARAVPYVTIPLSDDKSDHKNIARLNTGYVRKLKLEDRDGFTFLRAGMDFTEPEVKDKVLRGSIPDVSAGVPFNVTRRKDNQVFKAVLDHVCLTRKPFISDLGPFGLAAADADAATMPVEDYEEAEAPAETTVESEPENADVSPVLSARETETALQGAISRQLGLTVEYRVEDVRGNEAIVHHATSDLRWTVPFSLTGDSATPVRLSDVREWKLIEDEQQEPLAASDENSNAHPFVAEFRRAAELRESLFAQPPGNHDTTGGIQMSVLDLDGVELSDEARGRVQAIIEENKRLRRTDRSAAVDKRIGELSEMGLKDRPGALKLYREVMLSDDGAPASVLFADDGETPREKLTATQILDRFIEALKAEGGVQFSDQALASGNDNPPPKDAGEEGKTLEERTAEAKEALYGKKATRK